MSGQLVTKYVKLTESVAVPEEWPIHALREFLTPLIQQVIDTADANESVILQVINLPAKLVQCQDQNGKKYCFRKVFSEELVGSYVIDVIANVNDKNIKLNDVTPAGIAASNTLACRVSLDDNQVHVYQSKRRTTYHLIPTAQTKTDCNIMFLLAAIGIPPLLFTICLIETYGN